MNLSKCLMKGLAAIFVVVALWLAATTPPASAVVADATGGILSYFRTDLEDSVACARPENQQRCLERRQTQLLEGRAKLLAIEPALARSEADLNLLSAERKSYSAKNAAMLSQGKEKLNSIVDPTQPVELSGLQFSSAQALRDQLSFWFAERESILQVERSVEAQRDAIAKQRGDVKAALRSIGVALNMAEARVASIMASGALRDIQQDLGTIDQIVESLGQRVETASNALLTTEEAVKAMQETLPAGISPPGFDEWLRGQGTLPGEKAPAPSLSTP